MSFRVLQDIDSVLNIKYFQECMSPKLMVLRHAPFFKLPEFQGSFLSGNKIMKCALEFALDFCFE